MKRELIGLGYWLSLKPVVLPNGFTVEPTPAFKEFFGEDAPAGDRRIPPFLLEDIGYGGHQGIVQWKFEQKRCVFLARDWPTLRLISAFGYEADHCSPARARQLRFAAKIEGNRALLGLSLDPDPRMIDDSGNMIGNILAVIAEELHND